MNRGNAYSHSHLSSATSNSTTASASTTKGRANNSRRQVRPKEREEDNFLQRDTLSEVSGDTERDCATSVLRSRQEYKSNEHLYHHVQKNSNCDYRNVKVLTGADLKRSDFREKMLPHDLSDNNDLLKVYVSIKQPKEETSTEGPVDTITLKMKKKEDPHAFFAHRNQNYNANTDDYSEDADFAKYRSRFNRVVIDDLSAKYKKQQQIDGKRVQYYQEDAEEESSSEDFHSIRDSESVNRLTYSFDAVPHRNNNALMQSSEENDDEEDDEERDGEEGNYEEEEYPQQGQGGALRGMTRTSTQANISNAGQQVPQGNADRSGASTSSAAAANSSSRNGGDSQDPIDAVIEDKPQKLTLNAQIKLKIYQNENGEIAVQQEPASRATSRIELSTNTNFTNAKTTVSTTTITTTDGVHHSSTIINAAGERAHSNLHLPAAAAAAAPSAPQNTNNSNNLIYGTKNFYMKHKKVSAVNNKVLYYEEKEMQMSETSTLLSEQDANEYNQYRYRSLKTAAEPKDEKRASTRHTYNKHK